MNPYTGHLIALDRDDLTKRLRAGYEELPRELERAAARKLDGQPEAYVNLKSRSSLAEWARKKRRAKIAAASRRTNRKAKR